ncbi:MAG: tetratricopeptide repeat protein [Candidatus Tectimicrobiota bacterium]
MRWCVCRKRWLTLLVSGGCVCTLLGLWLSVALANEQGEVAYAKGIMEYGRGNYLEALDHFKETVELLPENANGYFYLGLTQSRLGDYASAIAQLEKALQRDMSLQYIPYHLGFAYFQDERYAEALPQFQRAARFDPRNAATQYYTGVSLYQLKRYEEALAPFERVPQLDPALAISAQYYSGLTLFELERDAQARSAFEAARAADPDSTIGRNAQQYLETLQARERERRIWQVEGNVSLQFDDNVILEPNDIAISRRADGRVLLGATGRLTPWRTPTWQLGAEYNLYQSVHFTLHDFDIRTHVFGIAGRYKLAPLTLRATLNYAHTSLDNDRFSEALAVQPSLTWQASDTLFTTVSLPFRVEDYFSDVTPGQARAVRRRDGWNLRPGIDQYWLFNQKRSYARLGYKFEVQQSQGSDWDYTAHEISLGAQTPLWLGLTLDVNAAYNRYAYRNRHSFDCCLDATRGVFGILEASDTRKRFDERYTISLALSRDLNAYLTVSAGYIHITNQANLLFFDYHRNIATLALSGRY